MIIERKKNKEGEIYLTPNSTKNRKNKRKNKTWLGAEAPREI